ncbi:hypothetical protein DJ564_25685 [Pseudomonas sp. 31-12]|nr:hypothetical protein DJ564_25685 [Pseudomonas sp. 31-12]
MRGKLQNFAKAAILAIAQQNCSIDDALICTQASGALATAPQRPRDGALVLNLQAFICEYL